MHSVLQIASVRLGEYQLELLQQDVGDGEIGVMGKQVIQPTLFPHAHDVSSRRQRESLLEDVLLQIPVVLPRLCVLLLERGTACRQYEPHVFEQLVFPLAVLLPQFILFAASHQGNHRIVVEVHDMEEVVDNFVWDAHSRKALSCWAFISMDTACTLLIHSGPMVCMKCKTCSLFLHSSQNSTFPPPVDIDDHHRVPVLPMQ